MTAFFEMFVGWIKQLIGLLEGVSFDMFGYSVNFASILFAFLVVNIVVTVMWKGAQG